MEKAIKPCSLINGHHQDLFPAQIKLKVMDGATSSRQSWGRLVLSDGPCPAPGSLGSRGPAEAGQQQSQIFGRQGTCVQCGRSGRYVGRLRKIDSHGLFKDLLCSPQLRCAPPEPQTQARRLETCSAHTARQAIYRQSQRTAGLIGRGWEAHCPPWGCAQTADVPSEGLG